MVRGSQYRTGRIAGGSPVFYSGRILLVLGTAFLLAAALPGHAQIDLNPAKQVVRECVAQVRQEASRREHDQLGQAPMWRNFDAYVSPDGRVHNNTKFVGERDGVYLFEKCLAERGFSLGSTAPNPPKPDTCTEEELDHRPGDCWVKISLWEKRIVYWGFVYGWLHGKHFAERWQNSRSGTSHASYLTANFDHNKLIPYFDALYSAPENRTIWWSGAFDLLFRTQTNPETKDIPALTLLYRQHNRPIISGYLRKFIPPNKVVISDSNDAFKPPPGASGSPQTVTLLGVSEDSNTKAVSDFMAALLNIKQCNTLIRQTEEYKFYTYLKNEEDRQRSKEVAERAFYPQLKVLVEYPWKHDYKQEEFFNARDELSGVVLLDKTQSVCAAKKEGESIASVNLGQLMLEGVKDQNDFSAYWLDEKSAANGFINLNQYLKTNRLRGVNREEDDPRPGHQYFSDFFAEPTPEGVKKILTVGAAQQ